MPLDYLKSACSVFEGVGYQVSDTVIRDLAIKLRILEERNLSKLNRRLLAGGQNLADTLSELNFAVQLLSYHGENIPISYEPDEGLRRPPDFKIVLGEMIYWVQMKRLSNLERENRQKKIIKKIKRLANNIRIGLFFGCDLSEHFSNNHVPDLIEYLSNQATNVEEGKTYYFPNDEKPLAELQFWHADESRLSSLTLGMSGDIGMVDETGLAESQLKQSLMNAAGAFEWDVDLKRINLVAMEATQQTDSDLCNAVFGTEFDAYTREGKMRDWGRKTDGFFLVPEFSNKIAGIIVLRKPKGNPLGNYVSMLYVNEKFKDRLSDFNKLLCFAKIIYRNMRPPNGDGNFNVE